MDYKGVHSKRQGTFMFKDRGSWITKEYTPKDKAHLCLKTEVHVL